MKKNWLEPDDCQRIKVTVGPPQADLAGYTSRAIQAAVDYVASLGGGTVLLRPGVYEMQDSLHLRPGVCVQGSGADTILRKNASVRSELSADLGYGHYDVSVARPELFQPGMGVRIRDDSTHGFAVTVASLTWRKGDLFGLNRALEYDYSRRNNGSVVTVFPVISGYYAHGAAVRDLVIDGNRDNNEPLNGCRGGGVFLLRSHDVTIQGITVHHYNGEGISFQQCRGLLIEDSICHSNSGNGLHPGSGSTAIQMRRLQSYDNGQSGVFYCLRVTDSVLEDCDLLRNGFAGISIGGRDTDHVIRNNRIEGNRNSGVLFRDADRVMAGNRNHLENNRIVANGTGDGGPEIDIQGETCDVSLVRNCIQPGSDPGPGWVGARISAAAQNITLDGNEIDDRTGTAVLRV